MGGEKRTFQELSKDENDLDSTAESHSRQLFKKHLTPPTNLNSNQAIPTMSRELIMHHFKDSVEQRHQPSSSSASPSLGSNSLQLESLPSSSVVICDSLQGQLKEALKIFTDKFTKKQLNNLLAYLSSRKDIAEMFLASKKDFQYQQCLQIIANAQRYCRGVCNGRPISDYPQFQRGASSPLIIPRSLNKQLHLALNELGGKLSPSQYRVALLGLSSCEEVVEKFLGRTTEGRYYTCLEYVALQQGVCNGRCNEKTLSE